MNLKSPISNPIMFKALSTVDSPNWLNTLHEDRKHGNRTVLNYCQKFHLGSEVPLQFNSTVNTVPVLIAYNYYSEIETIVGTLVSTLGSGTDTVYYFNFTFIADSAYQNKKVHFELTQGTETLTSEPILTCDFSNEILNGELLFIEYTNFDRMSSDIPNNYVDWSAIDSMSFWIESVIFDLQDKDETELLETADDVMIISAQLFAGINFETDPIPDYLCRRLAVVSSFDMFTINGLQYVKDGGYETGQAGSSTSFQAKIKLVQKAAIGINVDDVGIEETDKTVYEMSETKIVATDAEFTVGEGYYVHTVKFINAIASGGNATVTASFVAAGDDLIDATMGVIPNDGKLYPFIIHNSPGLAGVKIYFTVTGTSLSLTIIVDNLLG